MREDWGVWPDVGVLNGGWCGGMVVIIMVGGIDVLRRHSGWQNCCGGEGERG